MYKRTVHLSYICIYAEQQKVLRKGGLRCSGCGRVKVQWVWESCTEEVVLDCFYNRFDRGGGNSRQGKCLSKDVM